MVVHIFGFYGEDCEFDEKGDIVEEGGSYTASKTLEILVKVSKIFTRIFLVQI